ncbi:HD-GYP domain-containing protein [Paenibacillus piri]|uniref:HD-GYP domain-containing protein n=1 Tax=Paenibacillus piri TaxID=2547395 RepID=A0A4V6PIL4_9BACL|nr:HD-GYP domain-containing protein [Paenibacillus piri]TDG00645.1 HD-GYP domain-containing protein [Paenibacillus piri]
MKISVMELHVGDRTGSDVFNWNGLLVVSAHTVLNGEDIEKLHRHNIDYVDIMLRYDGAVPEEQESPGTIREIKEDPVVSFSHAVDTMKMFFYEIGQNGFIDESHVESALSPLTDHLKEENDVVSLLLTLNSQNDYTYQHCVHVGMLSYYMAKWLGYSEKEALTISKAGYLHDIGKSRISDQILNKPDRLTDEEFEEVKRHAKYGYELVKASGIDEAIALAALQHHERMDGSGYPSQLRGDDIHPYARIVAVADVYSAMISNRAYQKKQDMLLVLKELNRLSFGQLDGKVTQVFIRNMVPNFIGKKITLSSGETGFVVMTHPSDFFKPLVQIENRFVNLAEQPELEIMEIYQ